MMDNLNPETAFCCGFCGEWHDDCCGYGDGLIKYCHECCGLIDLIFNSEKVTHDNTE